jgi:hypothetical protein
MISERLRATAGKGQGGPLKAEAADVIDALVAVAERVSAGEWSDEGHTALREAADAALTLARRK